jgi:hypothetical protein
MAGPCVRGVCGVKELVEVDDGGRGMDEPWPEPVAAVLTSLFGRGEGLLEEVARCFVGVGVAGGVTLTALVKFLSAAR